MNPIYITRARRSTSMDPILEFAGISPGAGSGSTKDGLAVSTGKHGDIARMLGRFARFDVPEMVFAKFHGTSADEPDIRDGAQALRSRKRRGAPAGHGRCAKKKCRR